MKTSLILSLAAGALLLAGCVTTNNYSMSCPKCGEKMMQAAATDAKKCAMCSPGEADHSKPADGKAAPSEHKH
ncbi:MAG: hypothetical protein EBS05_08380 [Proteobacteria bacterium]|nr:hypothetical protein [Pseudomonadota bacterium]